MGWTAARTAFALIAALGVAAGCTLTTDLSGYAGGSAPDSGGAPPIEAGADATDASDAQTEAGNGEAGAASAYAAAVLADGPLAYFRLGEPAGAVKIADATTHGNTGALGLGHTFGVTGALTGDKDTALHLDGIRSGIDLGARFDFVGQAPYSLEIWAKIDLVDLTYRHFFKKSIRSGPSRDAYGVFIQDGVLTFERIVAGANINVGVAASSIMNRWAHVVATYDGAMLRLYVDGAEVAGKADARAASAIDSSLLVGCNGSLDNGVISGDLDEVAIYDTALSPARIKAHTDRGHAIP